MGQISYTQANGALSRAFQIPANILVADLLSKTSNARVCFTSQKFSANLQAFMINYVLSVSGYYSVYK